MPDIYFDVDTALNEVPVNIFPLTDDTDFKTRETDVAYNATGMDLVWNFVTTSGAMTQTAVTPTTGGAYDWTHQGDGIYSIEIPASGGASINNDTEGFGWFSGVCTGVLPWRGPVLGFRASGINDKLIDDAYSTTRGLSGTALPAAAADAAGGIPISDAGGLDLDTQLATLTNGTYGLSAIENLVDDLESRLTAARAGYLDNLSAGAVALASGVTVSTNNDKTGYTLTATPPTAVQIRQEIDSNSTQLSAIIADTSEIQGELADGGRTDLLIDSIKTVTDKIDTAMQTDGAVYQFTTNALENAPSGGGGGDATAANQTIIINHLTGIKGATFSGATDSLEAIRDRGDAAWVTGGGLSGSNTALITVRDGSGNNIVDAYVDIFDSGNTSFQQRFITNSSGQVTFSINDGTWYIRILKSGYTFTAVSFVVSGNYTHTYNMIPYVITPPSSPDLCRVYTYVYKPDGTFHTTLSGIATIGVYTEDNQYYTYQSTAIYSNTTGLIYWDIKQGASAVLTITELEYFTKSILVPDLATSELNDL